LKTVDSPLPWRSWAPPILWALTILSLSGNLGSFSSTFGIFKWVVSWIVTLDIPTLESLHLSFRKVLHVICYGVLAVLWFRALMASSPHRPGINRILALILCLMVALGDEGRQYLHPVRSASWGDVALDLSGGVLFLFVFSRYWERKGRFSPEARRPPIP